MQYSSLVGSVGVSLLLIAFFLNLFGWMSQSSKWYILLNLVGAGLSCYASVLIHYTPFILLEATWCIVSAAGLVKNRLAS